MTNEHVMQLVRYNKEHSRSIKQRILDAIKDLEDASPHRIKKYLDLQAKIEVRSEIRKEYEKGDLVITAHGQKFYTLPEIKKRLKEKTVDIRTIHRKLAGLLKEGILENKGGRYYLSTKAKSDIRYFPEKFGKSTLFSFMESFFPKANLKDDLQKLVNIFGVYLILCFTEASRPSNDINMTNYDKDSLVKSYLENVFPIKSMYDHFLSIMENCQHDSMNQNKQKLHKSAPDLCLARLEKKYDLISSEGGHKKYLKGKPIHELDIGVMEMIYASLMRSYPEFYDKLAKVKSDVEYWT